MSRTRTFDLGRVAAIRNGLGAAAMTLGLSLAFMAGAQPASAQSAERIVCKTHGDVVDQLGQRYEEQRVALGLASNGGLVEVYSTQSGSTWTIVITTPGGLSCPVSAGEDWFSVTPKAEGPQA